MPSNQCPICLKEFKFPYLLKRHNERKNPCKSVEKENDTKMIPNDTKMIPNDTKMIPDDTSKNLQKIFICKYCNTTFNSKRSLYRQKNE